MYFMLKTINCRSGVYYDTPCSIRKCKQNDSKCHLPQTYTTSHGEYMAEDMNDPCDLDLRPIELEMVPAHCPLMGCIYAAYEYNPGNRQLATERTWHAGWINRWMDRQTDGQSETNTPPNKTVITDVIHDVIHITLTSQKLTRVT